MVSSMHLLPVADPEGGAIGAIAPPKILKKKIFCYTLFYKMIGL